MKNEEADKARAAKWNWFTFVYMLADGDPTKFEAVMSLNMIFALSFKSFETENKKIAQYYFNHGRS